MNSEKLLFAIIIMAVVTAALRFAPFLIFSGRKTPKTVRYLGLVLPYAVMGMLVVYCLKDVSFQNIGGFMPALISCGAVVGLYAWRKSTLLSIVCGTVCYMLLVRLVF